MVIHFKTSLFLQLFWCSSLELKTRLVCLENTLHVFNIYGFFTGMIQVGAEPVDVMFCIVRRGRSGEKCSVRGGGRPRSDLAGWGVEVHTFSTTNQQTGLQHVRVSTVDGHGVVSGEWHFSAHYLSVFLHWYGVTVALQLLWQ